MSRIAKNSIKINKDISCIFDDGTFEAKGKLGEIKIKIDNEYKILIENEEVSVLPKNNNQSNSALWGTTRALVANSIKGVSEGFTKILELNGTGYRASISGSKLKLQLGYSHDIDYNVPENIKVECPKQNIIKITSFDKAKLGAVAAEIRSFRKPEPFKGKGIKYENEFIFRKEGKKK
ncbi:50S ribosomal protein L6 [Pelagibacteraceae bacterium]|nr:50S ribosomal protein L6 [Pelagibacteraceae bacterium]